MVHYKLTYFNFRGLGELARLILHHEQIEFEDFRIDRSEWMKYKSTTPFGQVPVLEVDGKALAQSNAISRYLARQHGLAGKDAWEQAEADMYVDCISDLVNGMRPFVWEQDPEKKKQAFQKWHQDAVVPHVKRTEERLAQNGTGFLVGDALTWADLFYFAFFGPMVETHGEDIVLKSPHLLKLISHVGSIPQIKAYVESRPKTDI